MLELVRQHPRYGYRRIGALLRDAGFRVNRKRVYRLWRQQGLKVPRKTHKKRRLGHSVERAVQHGPAAQCAGLPHAGGVRGVVPAGRLRKACAGPQARRGRLNRLS